MAVSQETKSETKPSKRKFGGPQPGSGRPKGSLGPKARTLAEVKNRIALRADAILDAELVEGLGVNVVLKLDQERKQYIPVEDPKEIIAFINTHRGASGKVGDEYYIIAAKPGNFKVRQNLLDRAFGKASHSITVKDDRKKSLLTDFVEMMIGRGYTRDQVLAFLKEADSSIAQAHPQEEIEQAVKGLLVESAPG